MSRYARTFYDKGISIAWGKDHACGLFLQIFNIGEEEPFIDEDALFTGLTMSKMNDLLGEHVGTSFAALDWDYRR